MCEAWNDDYEEILAKWRQDPANLEPWFTASSDSMTDFLRLYEPSEIGPDGYPAAWHRCPNPYCQGGLVERGDNESHGAPAFFCSVCEGAGSIKALVRQQAENRCVRCLHPYRNGAHGSGEWSPCDEQCTHRGPVRLSYLAEDNSEVINLDHTLGTEAGVVVGYGKRVEAKWRILTVHHLNERKNDCRWWNLVSLCQRCHLQIQGKVDMARVWPWEHSTWFRPYVAGYYAFAYRGEELDRPSVEEKLDELLDLERVA